MSEFLYTTVSVVAASATVGIQYPGYFHGIQVGSLGTNPIITIYDSLTPSITTTLIGKIVPTITGLYSYDVNFRQGLQFIVTGSPVFTILYLDYKVITSGTDEPCTLPVAPYMIGTIPATLTI